MNDGAAEVVVVVASVASVASSVADDDARAVVVVDVEFVAGTTTAPEALERTESQGSLNEGRRHQHLFRLTSYTRPTWCAVCGGAGKG